MRMENWPITDQRHTTFFWCAVLFLYLFMPSCKTVAQDSLEVVSVSDSISYKDVDFQLIHQFDVQGKSIAMDQLNNTYLITDDDELIKYDSNGKEVYNYSNFELGPIQKIDASNPFNLLIFYQEYQSVEILDRTLDKTAEFDLFQSNAPNIKAVGISNDQNVWIYDEINFRLKKLDTSGRIIQESIDLSNIVDKDFSPNNVIESLGQVYVIAPHHPIMAFDIFGNFIEKEDFIIPSGKLQLRASVFVYHNGNTLVLQPRNTGFLNKQHIRLPFEAEDILDVELQKNRIVILTKNQLSIYTFEEN